MMPRALVLTAILAVLLSGCGQQTPQSDQAAETEPEEVVVYTALDRQFSEPILADFTARTGIKVLPVYDSESTKTVGLVNRIRAEKARPRCDVFWNNEILNTLCLKGEGLLQPCQPAQAENYPARYHDPGGHWYGFAARARVIIVNTELVNPERMPSSINDLADPQWKGRIGIAKPLFGTTASHAASLFAQLGREKAEELFNSFKQNDIQIVAGNKTCAEMVGAGRLAFGLTDTDDAIIEQEAGKPVAIVFPDGGADQMGTLLLPNTLALVRNCPHPAAGERLIDYLLSPAVEARLAEGSSAQIPLHAQTTKTSRVCRLSDIRQMEVDFAQAAAAFGDAAGFIENTFLVP